MGVDSIPLLLLALAAAVVCLCAIRRPWAVRGCLAGATLLLIASAAGVRVPWTQTGQTVVLVDVSPSTRGLWYRNPRALQDYLSRSAPNALTIAFADGALASFSTDEAPANHTRLPHISADTIVLLSDGQFDVRSFQPVGRWFSVVYNDETSDARLLSAERDGHEVVVEVANTSARRTLRWPDGTATPVDAGGLHIAKATAGGVASLDAGDAWPENDSIHLPSPVPEAAAFLWIGADPPADARPVDLSLAPDDDVLLSASSLVLNNVSADEVSAEWQAALVRYVRDAGGSVVFVGGDRSFSAGGWAGTVLDNLSPLSSRADVSNQNWVILIDASGSMATEVAGQSRLAHAVRAAQAAAKVIGGPVAVASFSRDLRWWPTSADTPPAYLRATGPTNLRLALESVSKRFDSARVILLSDGQADLGEISMLEATLRERSVRIDWIALGNPDETLARLVEATGGQVRRAGEVTDWSTTTAQSVRQFLKVPADSGPLGIQLTTGDRMSVRDVNNVRLRGEAEPLGVRLDTGQAVAARWRVGLGSVAALGYSSPPQATLAIALSMASKPITSDASVRWDDRRVTVEWHRSDAAARPELIRSGGGLSERVPLEQTGPARFEATFEPAESPSLATIVSDGRVLSTRSLSGVYAREFRSIGLNRDNLQTLAHASGGALLRPDEPVPTSIDTTRSLATPLCGAGVAVLAVSLVLMRRAG